MGLYFLSVLDVSLHSGYFNLPVENVINCNPIVHYILVPDKLNVPLIVVEVYHILLTDCLTINLLLILMHNLYYFDELIFAATRSEVKSIVFL